MTLYELVDQQAEVERLRSEVLQLKLQHLKQMRRSQQLLGIAQELAADVRGLRGDPCKCDLFGDNCETISFRTCALCRLDQVEEEIIREEKT